MSKRMAAMSPAFPRKGGKKVKTMKKLSGQTEGDTPRGVLRGGGSTTRGAAKRREKRLEKVPM